MIFETLNESAQQVLPLVGGGYIHKAHFITGGFCHVHLRRDGQLTIREIISTKPGAGKAMLDTLKQVRDAKCLFAKCPCDLPANAWYERRGFQLVGEEKTKSGRMLNLWRLSLS